MDFFNNKKNEKLKFKINSEGIDTNEIKSRLIFETTKNENYIFYGKIENNVCIFDIPELKIYEKNDCGKINFEIISGDLYFPVWNDNFEIKTKVNITLEKLIEETVSTEQNKKPKISTEMIVENNIETIIEPIIKTEIIPGENKDENIIVESKEKQIISDNIKTDTEIKTFSDFLKD